MTETIRAFIALDIPANTKAFISKYQKVVKNSFPAARWTRPEGFHFTLKFLGEIETSRIDDVLEAAQGAARAKKFFACFGAAGVFPNALGARVLWLGLDKGADSVRALASGLSSALAPLGFPTESRPFTAHLTLARFRTPCRFDPASLPAHSMPDFEAARVSFYKSDLKSSGAEYTPLAVFDLE
ncbi:MAG: 2'-5'-RNA ligase [bacterium ADurb.Bin236]|nr:MAG: 2'-5'-RNA ligase [bacterium ADurb.Bin236]HOY63094.1 RNA 2',3'-cyclic phosphodiesterase [bacterium]HPN93504.1 RNA 2',3'-cyclic phosphodiesterase [bacterium]